MGDASSHERHRRRDSLAPWRQAFHKASEHRHLVLGCGVLLIIAAFWFSSQHSAPKAAPQGDDGLTELEGFDIPPAPVWGMAEQAAPLVLPPSSDEAPIDLRSALANSPIASPSAEVSAANFVSPSEEAAAWFTGTIEPAEESISPRILSPQESAIRYVRPAHHE